MTMRMVGTRGFRDRGMGLIGWRVGRYMREIVSYGRANLRVYFGVRGWILEHDRGDALPRQSTMLEKAPDEQIFTVI